MFNITTQIVLETNLYMSFTIKHDRLCFELDEPEDKALTITVTNLDYKHTYTINQDDQLAPLDNGSYIFQFNTSNKTALKVIFSDNKLAFELM
jgi:hypothetical protein